MVRNAAAISGPLSSTIATRSPAVMPFVASASPVASASARNPLYDSGTPPGAFSAGASSAPAFRSSLIVDGVMVSVILSEEKDLLLCHAAAKQILRFAQDDIESLPCLSERFLFNKP